MTRALAGRHALAVTLGALLGAGVFFVPHRVENLGGPATPLSYLLATLAALSIAVCYATFLSSPLGERDGLPYLAVSRTAGSRAAGFLAVWPTLAAGVALLALAVDALGSTLAATLPLSPLVASFAVLAVVVAVHARGPVAAGRVQLLVTAPLVALLAGMALAGLTAVYPSNFDPLFPTPSLRTHPGRALGSAAVVALFGFFAFDAGAAVAPAVRDPRRTAPRALVTGVVVAGAVATVAAFVTLGVIPWSRLVYASAPFTDAAAPTLGVGTDRLLVPGSALATAGVAFALAWVPVRTFRGFADVLPAPSSTRALPVDASLVVVAGAVAGLLLADAVGYALYLSLAGLCVQYLAVCASAAALPFVRPALYRRCRFRPPAPALLAVSLVGVAAACLLAWRVVALDPVTTLGYSRWAPALSPASDAFLLVDPVRTVLPALVAWETLGVAVYVVAGDYRAARGVDVAPLAAAYEE
ncbi:MAG: APC family permease [Haloplanus sp.]